MVTNVMEALLKRVLIAESETAFEKERVTCSQEEIRKKETQLECMSLKPEEMKRFAMGTNGVLVEKRWRIEDCNASVGRRRDSPAVVGHRWPKNNGIDLEVYPNTSL
ncbi:hypothetical protein Droror1_Dr00010902 [Drosera rotundifolia]